MLSFSLRIHVRRNLAQWVGIILTWVSGSLTAEDCLICQQIWILLTDRGDASGEVNVEYTGQMHEEEGLGQMGGGEDLNQMGEGEDPGQVEEDCRDSEDGQWIPSQIYFIMLIWHRGYLPWS
jgi:hypothetical protein